MLTRDEESLVLFSSLWFWGNLCGSNGLKMDLMGHRTLFIYLLHRNGNRHYQRETLLFLHTKFSFLIRDPADEETEPLNLCKVYT